MRNIGFYIVSPIGKVLDYDEYYNCIHGRNFGGRHGDDRNKEGHYDHHFGMSITGNFVMPPDGLYNGRDITYEFSGDDDMWVFVDGVLILDIGGIHNPASGSINFTDGTVTVNGVTQTNLKDKYRTVTGTDWDDSDFSNHDFRVFYMERGGMYSNLEVTFNLPLTPYVPTSEFSFNKVKAENESVGLEGAKFMLFTDEACTTPYTIASVPVTATSDAEGIVEFTNIPYGDYYMKEVVYPDGFEAENPDDRYEVHVYANGGTIKKLKVPGEITQIVNKPKSFDVEVEKLWKSGGNTINAPTGASVEVVLGRYKVVDDPNAAGRGIIVIKDSYKDLPAGQEYNVTYTITGPNGYSLTVHNTYTNENDSFEVRIGEVPAGVEYTVTKQVASVNGYTTVNAESSVNVTVVKKNHVDAVLAESSFTRSAYLVRVYALDNGTTEYLYSENYYPAGSKLSINISNNKATTWSGEHCSFTCTADSGGSHTFTSNGSWEFTNSLNSDIKLVVQCDTYTNWNHEWDQINTPTISGASPVGSRSLGRMLSKRGLFKASDSVTVTAPTPTLPNPPAEMMYVLDEEYAQSPDTYILNDTNGWNHVFENLTAYNENGPYVYYIASVTETGVPEGTEVTVTDEVTLDEDENILTVTNDVSAGNLVITKNVLKNGGADDTASGTFYYAVYSEEYNTDTPPTPVRTGSITMNGSSSAQAKEAGLYYGTYYVYELTGENGTPIISESSGSPQVINEICYTVTNSGTTAVVGTTDGAVTLTNNQETVDITATKQWKDKNDNVLTGSSIPVNAKVIFTLLEDGIATDHTVEVNGVDETANNATPPSTDYEGANWMAYFTGLPKYTNTGTLINYTVQEIGTWDGYAADGDNTVSSGGTIINKQQAVEINVLKVDKSDGTTPLVGARFVLKRYNEGYQEVKETWPELTVSSEEGKKGTLSIAGLTVGYYELEETVSPAGYVRTSSNPRFEITVNPSTKELEVSYIDNTGGMVTYNSDNKEFNVKNEPGAALPNTGGPGTNIFYMLGLLLTSFAGTGILMKRRRRKVA